jgi:hypothetical protein
MKRLEIFLPFVGVASTAGAVNLLAIDPSNPQFFQVKFKDLADAQKVLRAVHL